MKNLNNTFCLVMMCFFLCLGCKQITKSVDETFHPNDSLVKKYDQEKGLRENGGYKGDTKTSTTTTLQQQQEKTILINGDTVNTPEMESKAKEMFHDIELLKQKQGPANSKEIQKRVNEFLKDMNLPQPGTKNSNAEKPAAKVRRGMLSASQLAQAEEKLRQLPQYRDREIVLYESVHFYEDGSIKLALQHPENLKYVDAYQYKDGYWSEPKPVQARNIERRAFPLRKINFADAHKVMQIYNDKAAQVEGAKPTSTAYISIWDDNMRWFPSTINGSRERYDLQFNKDGTLKSFRQE